jgi:hypothetical protein
MRGATTTIDSYGHKLICIEVYARGKPGSFRLRRLLCFERRTSVKHRAVSTIPVLRCSASVRRAWAARGCAMGAHRRGTKTNLISGETVISTLLADLRSPPGFSLSTYCFQNSFLLRDISRLYQLLRSALLSGAHELFSAVARRVLECGRLSG